MQSVAVNSLYIRHRLRVDWAGVGDGRQVDDVAVENLLIPEEKHRNRHAPLWQCNFVQHMHR